MSIKKVQKSYNTRVVDKNSNITIILKKRKKRKKNFFIEKEKFLKVALNIIMRKKIR